MRGSPGGALDNFRRSRLPLAKRIALTLRNCALRFSRFPPRDCCGHDGEPGC